MAVKVTTIATLGEINLYREGLGMSPLKSLAEITEETPTQHLTSLKKQWAKRLGGWKGQAFNLMGLFAPMRISPATEGATRAARLQTALDWKPPKVAGVTGAPADEEIKLKWFVPGQVTIDVATGKYYDELGNLEIPAGDAQILRAEYERATTPPDTSLAREEFEWKKGQAIEHGGGYPAEISSEGGYDYQIYRDAEGVARDKVRIGTTPAATQDRVGMTDWERAQIALREKEAGFEREKWTTERDWKEKQSAEEARLLPERMALQYEIDRQKLIAGIPTDDWITRWTVQNQPNPYRPPRTADQVDQLETTLDRETAAVQYNQKRLAEAITAGADIDLIREFEGYVKESQKQRDIAYNAWSSMKKEKVDWTPQPYPGAPEWLPKYAPGQVAGRMITPENVVTPSGQQLTQMPRSRASQLGYYADWTAKMGGGRSWRDILSEAEVMQPASPGFRRTSWTPAR